MANPKVMPKISVKVAARKGPAVRGREHRGQYAYVLNRCAGRGCKTKIPHCRVFRRSVKAHLDINRGQVLLAVFWLGVPGFGQAFAGMKLDRPFAPCRGLHLAEYFYAEIVCVSLVFPGTDNHGGKLLLMREPLVAFIGKACRTIPDDQVASDLPVGIGSKKRAVQQEYRRFIHSVNANDNLVVTFLQVSRQVDGSPDGI